jgi:catechol 2,3-dioxygenase-like lactoylglutathione lyase family enzyme
MRRQLSISLATLSLALVACPSAALAQEGASAPSRSLASRSMRGNQVIEPVALSRVGITVADLDRSVDFYTRVLGFEVERESEVVGEPYERLTGVFGVRMRTAELRLGQERIELSQYLAPEGRPQPADTRSNDRWFQHLAIVVSQMDSAYRVLRVHRVRHASPGPQLLPASNPNAGGIRAFYFKDPDGHHLELISFPPGKGDPRWQVPSRHLFLGIDHTAIVVGDTDASLRFYRDLLGFVVAGESRNYGPEQEHLNNVRGASLRITGLKLRGGIGLELLEYLWPADGRPYPEYARPNDLLHWHTVLDVPPGESIDLLATSRVKLVSDAIAMIPAASLGYRRGVMVRDPDGHAVLMVQR